MKMTKNWEIPCKEPDKEAMAQAKRHWDSLAKPLDSLGKLESILTQIAGIQRTADISLGKKAVLVYCADNGIIAEHVSQSDSSVTSAVALSMAQGRANINVMAHSVGAKVIPVDVGMAAEVTHEGLLSCRIMNGTRNFAKEPAMTREQCIQAIQTGIRLTGRQADDGVRLLAIGEMGIGNTTTSSAVASVLLDKPVEHMTGKGAGLTSAGLAHKKQVIAQAIALHKPDAADAIDVLSKVGGLDIAAMAGTCIGGMLYDVPVVLDGFISVVAALAAVRLVPECREYLIPSHASKEPAAELVLEALGLEPILHADMCLGEGTGAVLLFPILDTALAEYRSAHTFADIAVTQYEHLT